MAAIYCATQKYTVNSGLGIYDLTGSHRLKAEGERFGKLPFNGELSGLRGCLRSSSRTPG
jgi:hypothetical protein